MKKKTTQKNHAITKPKCRALLPGADTGVLAILLDIIHSPLGHQLPEQIDPNEVITNSIRRHLDESFNLGRGCRQAVWAVPDPGAHQDSLQKGDPVPVAERVENAPPSSGSRRRGARNVAGEVDDLQTCEDDFRMRFVHEATTTLKSERRLLVGMTRRYAAASRRAWSGRRSSTARDVPAGSNTHIMLNSNASIV
jgi:hypothetical protein